MLSKIARLGSKSQYLLAVCLGSLGALAFPPLHIIFAPFIAFPLWLYLLEINQNQSWRRHFALGFWFALGYFTVGLYWITFALGVDLSIFWWLIPLSLFGIPIGLGVYVGTMSVLLKFTNSTGLSRCFWFATIWTMGELAWGSGPLALPWDPLGAIWSSFSPILQTLSVVGTYGLTLITALLVSLPILFRSFQFNRTNLTYIASLAIVFALSSGWGILRPDNTPVKHQSRQTIIRIVQPSIPQELDWEPQRAREQFYNLITLSAQKTDQTPDIIIWPESALPLLIDENKEARNTVAQMLPKNGYLVSGSLRRAYNQGAPIKVYNSLIVVGSDSNVVATYDKHHLVQFGEYLPLRDYIPRSITKITGGDVDFSRGTGPETIQIGEIPAFSPLICFEAIFSGEVILPSGPRPEWILNITNDAWYGRSSGPYQHLQLTRMRSIEEGLPFVRASNSGISTVFDAFGREVGRLDLNVKGILDVHLPPALQESTIFSKYGQLILLAMLAAAISLAIITRRRLP